MARKSILTVISSNNYFPLLTESMLRVVKLWIDILKAGFSLGLNSKRYSHAALVRSKCIFNSSHSVQDSWDGSKNCPS